MANNRINIVISAQDQGSAAVNKFSASLGRIRDVALGVYLPQLAGKILDVGKAAIVGTAQFEQSRVAFDTMLGSAARAGELMQKISQFALETPFELPEVVEGSKKLLAFGVAAEDIIPTLRRLGDVSAGIGAPVGEIAELYGKARVQGRLFAEDINQFTGRGIPIIEALANVMGVAQTDIRKLVEEGKVGFPELEKAFVTITSEGSKFGGMMSKQSKTFNGVMSNISDSFGAIGRAALGMDSAGNIIAGGFFDRIKNVANDLSPVLSDMAKQIGPAMEDAWKTFDETVANIARAIDNTIRWIKDIPDAIRDAITWIKDRWKNALDIAGAALKWLGDRVNDVKGAFEQFTGWVKENETAIKVVATVLGVIFGPALIRAGVLATVTGVKMAASGVAAGAGWVSGAVASGAAWLVHTIKMGALSTALGVLMVKDAAVAGAAWVANAVKSSAAWLIHTARMSLAMTGTAIVSAARAADAGWAWILNAARASVAWVTTELPKIVLGFVTTSAAAVTQAAISSAAWISNATKSAVAWVVTELPKIIAAFVVTSASAVANAAIASAAWIAAAAKSAAAWVVTQLPRIIAAFVAMSASAVLQAGIASGAWVASSVKASASVTALKLLVATPMVMPAIAVAAAIAAIALVKRAYDEMRAAVEESKRATDRALDASKQLLQKNLEVQSSGVLSAETKARWQTAADNAIKLDNAMFGRRAIGTNYAPGGSTLVGEHGPEVLNLPAGSRVTPAWQSRSQGSQEATGEVTNILSGTFTFENADASNAFWDRLDKTQRLARLGVAS